jgi:hypothetical protein
VRILQKAIFINSRPINSGIEQYGIFFDFMEGLTAVERVLILRWTDCPRIYENLCKSLIFRLALSKYTVPLFGPDSNRFKPEVQTFLLLFVCPSPSFHTLAPSFQSFQPKMAPPGWIEWRSSAAREILLEDLEPDDILHQQDGVSAKEVFEYYSLFPEFEGIVFSQFEARLKDHGKEAMARFLRSWQEEEWLCNDRLLHPRQTHNERGELVFDRTEAKELLQEDVKNKVHETMEPADLQASRTPYHPFKPHIFRKNILSRSPSAEVSILPPAEANCET